MAWTFVHLILKDYMIKKRIHDDIPYIYILKIFILPAFGFTVYSIIGLQIDFPLKVFCATKMTNYQSIGRNQKPRGLRVKQALQFTLVLAICIWLLYQIKPSNNKNKTHGSSTWSKLSIEGRTLILGRKERAAWSSDSGSKGAHFVEENYATDDSNTENWKTNLVLERENAVMDQNDTDETFTETESGSSLQHHGMDSETNSGHIEMEDGKHSFPDENGIPEVLEKDYPKISFDHSSITSTNIRSKMSKSKAIPRQKSTQSKVVAENKDDGTPEDLENGIKVDAD